MIWFFLAGWVSGAVFMVMYAKWWITRHAKKVTADELIRDIRANENEEEKSND